jgi:cytochrome P450
MLELLGLPDRDENMMRHWSDRCSNFLFQPVAADKEAMAKGQREILDARQAYFRPLIEARRRASVEDMISAMACGEVAGKRLSDLEILATCNMIATTCGGTSRSAIGMWLWWLQRFPDQLAGLERVLTSSISPPRSSFTVAKWRRICATDQGLFSKLPDGYNSGVLLASSGLV